MGLVCETNRERRLNREKEFITKASDGKKKGIYSKEKRGTEALFFSDLGAYCSVLIE